MSVKLRLGRDEWGLPNASLETAILIPISHGDAISRGGVRIRKASMFEKITTEEAAAPHRRYGEALA